MVDKLYELISIIWPSIMLFLIIIPVWVLLGKYNSYDLKRRK